MLPAPSSFGQVDHKAMVQSRCQGDAAVVGKLLVRCVGTHLCVREMEPGESVWYCQIMAAVQVHCLAGYS
jgi:hypothetical protein